MDDVVINIVSEITSDDKSIIEFTTVGKMARRNDKWCLYYDESPEMAENTKTVIKITDDGTIKIIRSGENQSRLIVQEGKRYTSRYETAAGVLYVGISGTQVGVDLGENGGRIHLDYTVDINAGFASRNCVDITIRKEENRV